MTRTLVSPLIAEFLGKQRTCTTQYVAVLLVLVSGLCEIWPGRGYLRPHVTARLNLDFSQTLEVAACYHDDARVAQSDRPLRHNCLAFLLADA